MLYDNRLSGKKSKLGKSSIMGRDSISVLLFANFSVYDPHFWGLISTPLYLFIRQRSTMFQMVFKKL